MMFRRRTTDQVYATLQQVQRRITEAGPTTSGPAAPSGARPLQAFAPRPLQTNQGLGAHLPVLNHNNPNVRPTAFPGGSGASGNLADEQLPAASVLVSGVTVPRGTLQLPLQIAITLLCLWLGTLMAAWWLGMRQGRSDGPVAESHVTADKLGTADKQDPEGPSTGPLGDSIYVLQSVPTFTPELKATWQKAVEQYNNSMLAHPERGWKPYFGLREPENGGLQFVFGYANGQFGIDRSKFEDLARLLAAPANKNGGGGSGFSTAKWMSLSN